MKKAVKKSQKNIKVEKKEISELRKLAYIFGGIVLIFLIFYAIAYFKMNSSKKEDTSQTIQYSKILVSNILKQNKDEYFVLIYNDEKDYSNYYYNYINTYNKKENSLTTYFIDINDGFNLSYKNEQSSLFVEDVSNLKINEDALLKISNGKIVEAKEGMENIVTYIKGL